jgi:hypothetical protein
MTSDAEPRIRMTVGSLEGKRGEKKYMITDASVLYSDIIHLGMQT